MSEPRLTVRVNGAMIYLRVRVSRAGETFDFSFNAGSMWAANLLARAIESELGEHQQESRAEEYAAGWRDAKSKKRAKRTWFSAVLP